MSKTNLKDNIFIEGFINERWMNDSIRSYSNSCEMISKNGNKPIWRYYIYEGKTSDIPEELTKECCIYNPSCLGNGDRWTTKLDSTSYRPASLAIQSICKEDYCIIYKI